MRDFVMNRYVTDEMSKFKNFGDLESFIGSLNKRQTRKLGKWLSKWRKNGVYNNIMIHRDWFIAPVNIGQIVLGGINVEVRPMIEDSGYLLANICGNPKISKHKEFKSQGKINRRLLQENIQGGLVIDSWYPKLKNCILFAITEIHSDADIEKLVSTLREVSNL